MLVASYNIINVIDYNRTTQRFVTDVNEASKPTSMAWWELTNVCRYDLTICDQIGQNDSHVENLRICISLAFK